MRSTKAARRAQRTVALLDLAQLGRAQWIFGNVYEAVVKIPELLSDSADTTDRPPRSVLGPGSPVRYYLSAVPVALAGALGAVINGLDSPRGARWLAISTGCFASGAALYLVCEVNLKLFFAAEPPPPADLDVRGVGQPLREASEPEKR
jgi:hypothetical protein